MSRDEGPSKRKGKGADPRNWGNAGLSDSNIDFDVQREALETWNLTRDEVELNDQKIALETWKAAQEWARAQNEPVVQQDSDIPVPGSRSMSETSVLPVNITVNTPVRAARSSRGSGVRSVHVPSSDSEDSSESMSTEPPK